MSRVARSARVASKQRTEALSSTAKTIVAAETGELYIITSATPGALTLPAAADGAYFKVVWGIPTTGNAVFVAPAGAYFIGTVTHLLNGASVENNIAVVGDTEIRLTLAKGGSGTNCAGVGSQIEFVSDGTYWYLSAMIIADHADNAATFATS
tara:strand:- start:107 stop:565 length:459 start_codon:yes stop_codon:yes gene_type:complete